ncbi:nudix hydrolase 18, mitochondrial-like [Impatiens glandulifera]|uniref:nudix hydrolase 18, mitochondrial-like n=1 Tax=Impatiens glandulifera TaxID=253017 RepID=UPI001FB14D48|nr:nudix hydrolase 18, mitochondrial-like [Impatiens glandulifera]
MVAMDSARTGRLLQRYTKGRRLVVGCIPYRFKTTSKSYLEGKELEVLLISAQREGKGMLFPKGGWENDESMKEAALRETIEEAGVIGIVQNKLGKWKFKSKSHDGSYVAYMFPLLVKDQLDLWPEKEIRRRAWMGVPEAREACHYTWMKEALDSLACRLVPSTQQQQEIIEEDDELGSKQQLNSEEDFFETYNSEEVFFETRNSEEIEKVDSKQEQHNSEEV